MLITTIKELVPVLQTAIGPVILISGLGLLLLTMTNRLGRTIDRSRELLDDYESLAVSAREKVDREIVVLWKRASFERAAIMLASLSCLSAATLIIMLFVTSILQLDQPLLLAIVFTFGMACLSASLVFFLLEVNLTLSALRIELEGHRRH